MDLGPLGNGGYHILWPFDQGNMMMGTVDIGTLFGKAYFQTTSDNQVMCFWWETGDQS